MTTGIEADTRGDFGFSWGRVTGVFLVVAILPLIYAVSGFALFDSLRAVGLEPLMQAGLFAAVSVPLAAWLMWDAWRSGEVLQPALGIGLIVIAGFAANWDYPAKFVHVPQYAVLGALIALLHRRLDNTVPASVTVWALIGLAGFGDELIQGFLAERSFGSDDLLVDLAAGAGGYHLLRRSRPKAMGTRNGVSAFWICCILPIAAALAFLIFVCLRASALHDVPPPAAFATLAAASASCMLFVTLTRPADPAAEASEVRHREFAVCLAVAAMGVVGFYGALAALPLAFR